MINLELPLPPSGNSRNKVFTNRGKVCFQRKKETQQYYEFVFFEFRKSGEKTIINKCWADVKIWCTNKNRDADNVIKTLFDALQYGKVISNDRLIRKFCVEMVEGATENKVKVEIGNIDLG